MDPVQIVSWLRRRVRARTRIAGLPDWWSRRRDARRRARVGDYRFWAERYDTLGPSEAEAASSFLHASLSRRPLISLLLLGDRVAEQDAHHLLATVRGQVYEEWELLVVQPEPQLRSLDAAASNDARIRFVPFDRTQGRSALEVALEAASGEFGVLLDDAVRLRPHALLLVAHALEESPEAVLVYSDEDCLNERGERTEHWFKPDWNPALLRSQDYIGAFGAFRLDRARLSGAGGSATDVRAALYLHLTHGADARSIIHIPHVLFHRQQPCHEYGAHHDEIVRAFLASSNTEASVHKVSGGVRVAYAVPSPGPLVRLIVATAGAHDAVASCLSSLVRTTGYRNFRLTIVVSDETAKDARKLQLFEDAMSDSRVELLVHPQRPFNYPWVHNWAIARVPETLLCLVNDDVAVLEPQWLELMLGHALQPDVGAVGARLLYPDGTVQHGGVILGAGGVAAPYHQGLSGTSLGYHGRAVLDQDLSCVTAGCMVVRRAAFEEVGGFDERLAIAFNDVDFCIRLVQAGWRIVLAAGAELSHRESASLGPPGSPDRAERHKAERRLLRERWGEVLRNDPHYNPNLDLGTLGSLAFPPRVSYPWRSV